MVWKWSICIAAAFSLTTAFGQSMPVVGFLNSASPSGYAQMAAAFREGLKQTGFVPGESVQIEYRWANDSYDKLPELVQELVQRRVAVIFANSPSIPHAKNATNSIPIVFTSGDDPVRLGFVASLNRPGGNLTGVAIMRTAGDVRCRGIKRTSICHRPTSPNDPKRTSDCPLTSLT